MDKTDALTLLAGGRCEACGAAAAVLVNDFREGEPQRDDEGELWVTRVVVGTHLFCAAHERDSQTVR